MVFRGLIMHNLNFDPQYIDEKKISNFKFNCIDNKDYITAKIGDIDETNIASIVSERYTVKFKNDVIIWFTIDQINNATISIIKVKESTKFEDIIIDKIKPENITFQKHYVNATYTFELKMNDVEEL